MTHYNSYIILNFGFEFSPNYAIFARSGTGQYRQEHTEYGRIRFYHRSAPYSKTDHMIEVYIPTQTHWLRLKEHGLKKIFSSLTPGGTSKLVIMAHGHRSSTYFRSNPQYVSVRKRHGKPMSAQTAHSFHIPIKDCATLISNSLHKQIFNTEENFLAISLWSCLSGAEDIRSSSIAESLVFELWNNGIFARVRAPFQSIHANFKFHDWSLETSSSIPQQDPEPLNLYYLDEDQDFFSRHTKTTVPLHPSQEGFLNPEIMISTPTIMLLFLITDFPRRLQRHPLININYCLPRENFPYFPIENAKFGDHLISILSKTESVMQIVLNAIHFSIINTIDPRIRQEFLYELRYMSKNMVKTQNEIQIVEIGKNYINKLHTNRIISDRKKIEAIDKLEGLIEFLDIMNFDSESD